MKNFKRAVAFLLAAMLVVTAAPFVSFAQTASVAQYSDFPTGWSHEAMVSAVENGLIHGYEDSTVRPQGLLTRAEMAAIINRAFGAEAKADINGKYADVLPSDWFYGDIEKAVKMKTFEGVSANMMNPNAPITRQDAMLVIARVLVHNLDDISILNKFVDKADIAEYAINEIAALVGRGYINGYEDGTLLPKNNITREEFAQIMHNIFAVYNRNNGEISLGEVKGNVVLTGDNVSLKNSVINGDLFIGDGAFNTKLDLYNVKVTGRIVFRGASERVYFNAVTIGDLLVTNDMNEDLNGPVYFYHYSTESLFANAVYNTGAKFRNKTVNGGAVSGTGLGVHDTAYVGKLNAGTGVALGGAPGGPGGPTNYTVQFVYNLAAGEQYSGPVANLTISVPVGGNTIPAGSFPAITKAHHDLKTTWYVDADGDMQYDNGETLVDSNYVVTGNLTLRPMWDAHHKILLEIKDTSGNPETWTLYVDNNGAVEAGQFFPATGVLPEDVAGEVRGWFQDLDNDGIKDANEPYIAKGTDGGAASGTVTNGFTNKPLNQSTNFKAYKEYTVKFIYNDGTQDITIKEYLNVPHGDSVSVPTESQYPVLVGKDWFDGTNKITTSTIVVLGTKTINAATRILNVTFYDAGQAGYVVVGGPYQVPYGTVVDQAFIANAQGLAPIRTSKNGYVANNTNIHPAYPNNYTHTVTPEWYRAERTNNKFTLCDRVTSAGYTVTEDSNFYYLYANMQIGLAMPSIMNNANYNVTIPVDSKSNLAATVLDTLYNNGMRTAVTGLAGQIYDRISTLSVNRNIAGYDINYTPFTKDANGNLLINNVNYKYKLLDFLGAENVDTLIDDAISHMLDDDQLRHDIIVELLKDIAEEGTLPNGDIKTDGELMTKFDNIMMSDVNLLNKIKSYAKKYAKTSADYVNTTYIGESIEEELDTWINDFVPQSAFKNNAQTAAGDYAADYVETNYNDTIKNAVIDKAKDFASTQIAAKETEIRNEIKKQFIDKIIAEDASLVSIIGDPAVVGYDACYTNWTSHATPVQVQAYVDAENTAYNQVVSAVETEAVKAVSVTAQASLGGKTIVEDVQAKVIAAASEKAKTYVDDTFVANSYTTVKNNALANLKTLPSYQALVGQVVTMLNSATQTEVVYSDNISLGTLDVDFQNITLDPLTYSYNVAIDVNVPVSVQVNIGGTTIDASTTVTKNFTGSVNGSYTMSSSFDVTDTVNLGTYAVNHTITKTWVHGKIDAKVDSIFADQTKRRTEIIKLAGKANVREEIDAEIDDIIKNYSDDHTIMVELENIAHELYKTQIDAFKNSLSNHDKFTFDKDDTFIVDAMEAKLKTVTYDQYKGNFPVALRKLLGGDDADGGELKIIFDQALAQYIGQVDVAYNGLNNPSYNGTDEFFVDTFVMVELNPITHVVIPAFTDYVDGLLIPKLNTKGAWQQNPYTDMFESNLSYTMFVTALDPANVPAGCSGYRLNTQAEIYDAIYRVAVLANDIGNHFVITLPENEIDDLVEFVADTISDVYDRIANRISVLSSSTPVSIKNRLMGLVDKFMNKNTESMWNKSLFDATPYLDSAYARAIDEVITRLGYDASETITVNVLSGTTVQLSQGTNVSIKTADEIADAVVSAGIGTKAGNGVVSVAGRAVNIGNIITRLSERFGSNFEFVAEDTTENGKAHETADYLCAYKITLKTAANENYIYFRVRRG